MIASLRSVGYRDLKIRTYRGKRRAMFTSNPFAELSASVPPTVMQTYVVVMALLVVGGTLFDIVHKRSARYFFDNWRDAKKKAKQQVGGGEMVSIAVQTAVVDVLASGEFCNQKRRRRASARHVWLRHLRGRHGGHGVRLSDARHADAGDLAGAVVDRRADGLRRRLLVLVLHPRGRRRGGQLAVPSRARGLFILSLLASVDASA